MTTRHTAARILLAISIAFSPAMAHAYSVSMGSPADGDPYTKGANVTVTGAITWLNTSSNPNPPWVMQLRPTGCLILLREGSSGFIAKTASATISNIVQPNPPATTVGIEEYTGSVTIPSVTTEATYNVTARPQVWGNPIKLANGNNMEVTHYITIQ